MVVTRDTIAAMISQIHRQYDLNIQKISATVTDNVSNFGKAFREFFEESTTSAAATSVSVTITPNASEEQEDMEEDTVNDYEIDVINIGDILSFSSKIDDDDFDDDDSLAERISLPSQETCISHSLNLLATNDANKACDTDSAFKSIYHAALAKCTSI